LSVTGPYASRATISPVSASCAITATPIPYRPAISYEPTIAAAITITGAAVACIPIASPSMMFVACPVRDAFEIPFTGCQRVPV
jgi:hypothetical protein